ncbi:hypothetical protein B0H13DRAFT_2226304 [Mycena leptocephala]|nr:hypothetical protein B0H13DRAFT_2226304 [Mycena leptocephala]
MHKHFNQDQAQQHIFLLHGVGGAGKTQIALKFIQASSRFSDSFHIDASTRDTIDVGLENIALIKTLNTSQDALNWLKGNHDQWLLLFDNADDPEINLNPFLPQCDHGNIIITSRNPGLRVYGGSARSDAPVSDMEETDAVKLLLTSAAHEVTPRNEEMAAEIVQVSESGALDTYLGLYKQNQARLLSKKPVQSHDDYRGTLARILLQLCSFLHHQGISEKIFSKASAYKFPANGPSEEELQKPMEFLSQYLGPLGDWDSLRFTEVTNQLRAYSLIDFNTETGLFSIHPLVHRWSRSTLTDLEMYHYSMVAIVGMSITTIPDEDVQLAIQLAPHIDSLRRGQTQVTPDFNAQYASTYFYSRKIGKAAELEALVLEKRRATFGEDHPATLSAMESLAVMYNKLGQWNKAEELKVVAEELEVVVLEKRRETLGEDHPDTLSAMGNLAMIYYQMGRWNKVEELEGVVLEKRRETLGEDHPDTWAAMESLAVAYYRMGQWNKAEELLVVVLEKRRETLGEDHPDTLTAKGNLAVTYNKLGLWNKAEELEVVDHPDTLRAKENLAKTYHKMGPWKSWQLRLSRSKGKLFWPKGWYTL